MGKDNILSSIVFFKCLRMVSNYYNTSATHVFIKNQLIQIITSIWKINKQACFSIGRELIRIIQDVAFVPVILFLCLIESRI